MQFKGNIYSREKHYHLYTTDNYALSELGVASYTSSSLKTLFENPSQDMKAFFQSATADLFDGSAGALEILHCETSVDPEGSVYVLQTDSEIFQYFDISGVMQSSLAGIKLPKFLELYDKAIRSKDVTIEGYTSKDILSIGEKIQSSYSGCINFIATFTALNVSQSANIQLRLFNIENSNDERTLGTRSSSMVVGVPQSISGKSFSSQGSLDSPIGVMQKPFGGADNPKDSVAAPVDLRFNANIGKWQGGTHQSLARLTTDIDASNVGNFENLSNSSSVYDDGESSWKIPPVVGKAVILEMQNGNPYMYGPSFIGCPETGSREPDEVIVVNRSNNSFKRGEIVLVSYISGEWLIQKFSGAGETGKTKLGRWQFQKFIVNSDNFFSDERFKSDKDNYFKIITPNIYESKIRKKYYVDLLKNPSPDQFGDKNTLSKINLFIDNFKDSYTTQAEEEADVNTIVGSGLPDSAEYDINLALGYYQSTIFDQVGSNLGGVNPNGAVIGRTNLKYSPDKIPDEDGFADFAKIAMFWGPTFPYGYTAASVKNSKNKKNVAVSGVSSSGQAVVSIINNANLYRFLSSNTTLSLANAENDKWYVNENRMFSDINDINLLQLPAEIALNGSFKGKFSYPIEAIFFDSTKSLPLYFYDFLQNQERYSYLSESGVNKDSYSLIPINVNSIQFSPLQFPLALSVADITDTDSKYNLLKTEINYARGVFFRGGSATSSTFFPQSFIDRNGLKVVDLATSEPKVIGTSYISFGPYVINPTLRPRPLGGPGYIPSEQGVNNERSNLIGIIAAKNKFSTGGSINFTTEQEFGLPPQVTIAGGQGPQVTILGAFLAWNTPGNPLRTNAVPQWGDITRSDNYDSFGTTALHVRIFDQWPDEQTFYDGRYFSVLHFNPFSRNSVSLEDIDKYSKLYGSSYKSIGRSGSVLSVVLKRFNEKGEEVNITLDIQETSVDFREPTSKDGGILGYVAINKDTVLAPVSEWRLNPVRRGALLTGGGFKYSKKVIGVSNIRIKLPEDDTTFNGSGYTVDDIISLSKGVKLKVLKVDGKGSILSWETIDKGEGFLPSDFPSYIPVDGGTGSGAIFEILSGAVYAKYDLDKCPEERAPITRLSVKSSGFETKSLKNDFDVARGTLQTSITLDGNGKYDAFYFMHNDILHTQTTPGAFHGGYAQYINLQIT